MQEGRGEALPHRPFRAMALWDPSQTASRIKGLSSNAAPQATNEEHEAMAKSSVHAPKENPLFRVFSYRKTARPSIPPHKEKKPHKKEPSSA